MDFCNIFFLCFFLKLVQNANGHGYHHIESHPAGTLLSKPSSGPCRSDRCECESLHMVHRYRCGSRWYNHRRWFQMCTSQIQCSTPTQHCCQLTDWFPCDQTCGGGLQKRTVRCANTIGGQSHTCESTTTSETRPCNTQACPTPTTCTITTPFINEIHYHPSAGNEFIEVAGLAGADLSGYSLILYNGANGMVYGAEPLGVLSDDGTSAIGFFSVTYPTNGLQNGPDGIALVDNTGTVLRFLSYEDSFDAINGHAAGMTSVDIGVSQSSSANSLQLQGSGCESADFTWVDSSSPTKDAVNDSQTFSP